MSTIPVEHIGTEPVVELDLTKLDELVDARHARRFSDEHIVEWLRTSGGTLAERIMKTAAADLIEGLRPTS